MAVIKSAADNTELIVDRESNAARVTLYNSNGEEFNSLQGLSLIHI
jgi:hypothetical protein